MRHELHRLARWSGRWDAWLTGLVRQHLRTALRPLRDPRLRLPSLLVLASVTVLLLVEGWHELRPGARVQGTGGLSATVTVVPAPPEEVTGPLPAPFPLALPAPAREQSEPDEGGFPPEEHSIARLPAPAPSDTADDERSAAELAPAIPEPAAPPPAGTVASLPTPATVGSEAASLEAQAPPPLASHTAPTAGPGVVIAPDLVPAALPMPGLAPSPRHPTLTLIIDDLGMSPAAARRVIALPAPLTLAFLPYAEHLPAMTREARRAGHEIFLHLAMEPLGSGDPGPNALLESLSEAELRRRIVWAIGRVEGAVGANNHMGSRLTAEPEPMRIVMDELRAHGLFFIDSRTTSRSIAGATAAALGLPTTARDVFLDNEPEPAAILVQLAKTEQLARRAGTAVAIGHPYPATIDVLARWLPEARARGLSFVTARRMATLRGCRNPIACGTRLVGSSPPPHEGCTAAAC